MTRGTYHEKKKFFTYTACFGVSSLVLPNKAIAAPLAIHSNSTLLARRGKGPRIVIGGGGWVAWLLHAI